jgi:hypothetical protein
MQMVRGLAQPFAARLFDKPPEAMAVPVRISTPHCNKERLIRRSIEMANTKELQPPTRGGVPQTNDRRGSWSQARLHAGPEAPSRKALVAN